MFSYCYYELPVPLEKKDSFLEILSKKLQLNPNQIFNLSVTRYSLDSRKKNNLHWSFNVTFKSPIKLNLSQKNNQGLLVLNNKSSLSENKDLENSLNLPKHINVIGAGPAGLWTTLHLLRKGYSVDLYEQGKNVEARFKDIRHFFLNRKFNGKSNVLFGEGGAGAFSDGKLNTRTRNYFSEQVLKDMVDFGIDSSIISFAKPHIGTDKLVLLLRKIREQITNLGGKIHFNSELTDIEIQNHSIKAIKIEDSEKFQETWENCECLVLATGHSARKIYQLLYQKGVKLESKAFAMGVRVEHPQKFINERQLGKDANISLTGAAEYFLNAQTLCKTSSAYSFCMCPGGVLVPCASEEKTLATNGMSYSRRNGPFANSAIVVPIEKKEGLFDGLKLQQKIESDAFLIGGENYSAPAQTIKSFLENKKDKNLPKSTYPCGLTITNIWDWMDKKICNSLYEGFLNFEKKLPGFIKEGLIVAPETRTSSPLRISRNPNTLESINTKCLFVLGEGAGYSGGIVTSAADGIKLAFLAKKI